MKDKDNCSGGICSDRDTDMARPTSGEEQFKGVKSIEVKLRSAMIEFSETGVKNSNTVSVQWEVYCSDGASGCNPADLKLKLQQLGDRLQIAETYVGTGSTNPPQVKLRINGNHSFDFNIALENGAIKGSGTGGLRVKADNFTAKLRGGPESDTNIEIGNGVLDSEWRLVKAQHKVQVANGSITLRLLEGTSCKYEASADMGTVSVLDASSKKQPSTGTLGAGTAKISLHAGLGSVKLRVP
jgi:hypothetical protein